MSNFNLLDAIRVVKENERLASIGYAEAANNIWDPMGKKLFEQLSEFEKYHYDILDNLEKSLEETGGFIEYDGNEFPEPPILEIKAVQDADQKTVMEIINDAIDLEKEAEKAYSDLARQIKDPLGQDMFNRLAKEEHNHYRLLSKAYWALSNKGVWEWSQS